MRNSRLYTIGIIPLLITAIGMFGCSGRSAGPAPGPKTEAASKVDQRLIQADSRFGIGLFHKVRAEDAGKNVFLSPASASLALAMTYNGARGETQQAMAKALAVEAMTPADVNQANGALQTILANPDPKVQLEIANSIWYKQGLKVNAAFAKTAQDSYRAEVQPVAFGQPSAVKAINGWVSRATKERIPQIVNRTDALDRMYLINAIYFNGTWKEPFNEKSTRPLPFTRGDGSTKQHPMMWQSGRYRYFKGDTFQAAVLPYGEGRMSLYVFVPDKGVTLEKFYEGLTPANWESWMGRFAPKEGTVTIPKLKLEYSKELNQPLKDLGMGIAFTDRADFGALFDGNNEQLAISFVLQKTYLDMNEKGTEAAAVTVVGVVATSAPPASERFALVADRPYFIAIRDDLTGAVLFMGSIVDPQ